MTLSECTKEELIWICKFLDGGSRFSIAEALVEISRKRAEVNFEKYTKYSEQSEAEFRAYVEILKPYDGMKYMDIPLEVIQAADECIQRSREADKKARMYLEESMKN